MENKEKELIISKFRRADSWRFANYLIYKKLMESAKKTIKTEEK
jgi:hypothetical protein